MAFSNSFGNREASPDDIHHRGGWTPLHVRHRLQVPKNMTELPQFAVDHGCVEACRLLLNSGADATWEDNTGDVSVASRPETVSK